MSITALQVSLGHIVNAVGPRGRWRQLYLQCPQCGEHVPCDAEGHQSHGTVEGRQAKQSWRGTVKSVSCTGGIRAGPATGARVCRARATHGGSVTDGDQEHEGAAALVLPTLSPILSPPVCNGATPPFKDSA